MSVAPALITTSACAINSAAAGEANPLENFGYVFDPKLEELVMSRMDRNSEQAVKFLENAEIREILTRLIRNQVYDRIRSEMKSRVKAV